MASLIEGLLESRQYYRDRDVGNRLSDQEVKILARADLYRQVFVSHDYDMATRDKAAAKLTNLLLSGAYDQARNHLEKIINNR